MPRAKRTHRDMGSGAIRTYKPAGESRPDVLTAQMERSHWRTYRGWAKRWNLVPRPWTHEVGDWVFVPIPTGPWLRDLTEQVWCHAVISQPMGTEIGSGPKSVIPQLHGSRRHIPKRKVDHRPEERADLLAARVTRAIGGRESENMPYAGDRVSKPNPDGIVEITEDTVVHREKIGLGEHIRRVFIGGNAEKPTEFKRESPPEKNPPKPHGYVCLSAMPMPKIQASRTHVFRVQGNFIGEDVV